MSGGFLPKWLLFLVAFGVIGGHVQQVECKLAGCPQLTVAQNVPADHGHDGAHPANHHPADDCGCQCHFSTFVAAEAAMRLTAAPVLVATSFPEPAARAPKPVCAEINLPPQLA